MGTLRFFEEVVSFKIRRTFGFADYRERRLIFALFFYLSPVFPALFFALIGYGFHQLADLFGIAQKVIFHQT